MPIHVFQHKIIRAKYCDCNKMPLANNLQNTWLRVKVDNDAANIKLSAHPKLLTQLTEARKNYFNMF